MGTFNYSAASRLYQPWTETFDAASIGRQSMPGGTVVWFGQLTDGNSFWLTQTGTNITSMTISDGVTDYVTAALSLPVAPFLAMYGNSTFTNRDWVDQLLSGNDTIVGSSAGDRLSGGGGDDILLGDKGRDVLAGGAGNDVLDGGDGIDTADFSAAADAVQVDLDAGTATGQGIDTLISIEQVVGSAFADTLLGGAGNDRLSGGAGADLLAGGAGDDVLVGGGGSDTASYANAGAAISADLVAGTVVGEGLDTLIGIENLIGSDFADLLVGNNGVNRIDGGAGDDHIDGGLGNDILSGGLGDDVLTGGGGRDTASYALAQYGIVADLTTGTATGEGADVLIGITDLIGSNQSDSLTGDGAANRLDGGVGDDIIAGGAGADTLIGGFGNDSLTGGDGIDTVDYGGAAAAVRVDLGAHTAVGEGSDVLMEIENVLGSAFGDVLVGDAAANRLVGGGGADRLEGGGGRDVLVGGSGADRFVFTGLSDSSARAAGRDIVNDFSHLQGDRIDLSLLDADVNTVGDQVFQLAGASFTGVAGELIQTVSGSGLLVSGDVDGDRIADFSIQVNGVTTLGVTDFVL